MIIVFRIKRVGPPGPLTSEDPYTENLGTTQRISWSIPGDIVSA